MKLTTTTLLLFFSFAMFSQNNNTQKNQFDVNLPTSQIDASFPGGQDSLMNFILRSIIYPDTPKIATVSGEVQVSFDVNFDGTLINFSKITNFGFNLEDELIRVLKLSPKWIPAEVNKTKLRQQYLLSFPISGYKNK